MTRRRFAPLLAAALLALAWAAPTGAEPGAAALPAAAPAPSYEGHAPLPPLPRAEPSAFHVIADLVLARPIYLARLLAGIGAFPAALPVSTLLGEPRWALDVCIVEPAAWLFGRPLGEL